LLTQIDVNSENAFYVPIQGATPKDSLLVRNITGLTPPDINLFIGDYSRDGGIYQGRRVGNRNVVITMTLNPNPALGETVSGLRELLYKTFIDPLVEADFLQLNLHDEQGRVRYVVGYTEKFEGAIFDADTSLQISLICPDPYIRDSDETVLTNASGWTTVPFVYGGTAETGFVATVSIIGTTPTITLDNNGKTMVINRAFVAGDVVTINTTPGSRSIMLAPAAGGPAVSILANLTTTSSWLLLHSQANTFKIYGTDQTTLPATVTSLRFRQAYWGV
jgi:hypothetical protein